MFYQRNIMIIIIILTLLFFYTYIKENYISDEESSLLKKHGTFVNIHNIKKKIKFHLSDNSENINAFFKIDTITQIDNGNYYNELIIPNDSNKDNNRFFNFDKTNKNYIIFNNINSRKLSIYFYFSYNNDPTSKKTLLSIIFNKQSIETTASGTNVPANNKKGLSIYIQHNTLYLKTGTEPKEISKDIKPGNELNFILFTIDLDFNHDTIGPNYNFSKLYTKKIAENKLELLPSLENIGINDSQQNDNEINTNNISVSVNHTETHFTNYDLTQFDIKYLIFGANRNGSEINDFYNGKIGLLNIKDDILLFRHVSEKSNLSKLKEYTKPPYFTNDNIYPQLNSLQHGSSNMTNMTNMIINFNSIKLNIDILDININTLSSINYNDSDLFKNNKLNSLTQHILKSNLKKKVIQLDNNINLIKLEDPDVNHSKYYATINDFLKYDFILNVYDKEYQNNHDYNKLKNNYSCFYIELDSDKQTYDEIKNNLLFLDITKLELMMREYHSVVLIKFGKNLENNVAQKSVFNFSIDNTYIALYKTNINKLHYDIIPYDAKKYFIYCINLIYIYKPHLNTDIFIGKINHNSKTNKIETLTHLNQYYEQLKKINDDTDNNNTDSNYNEKLEDFKKINNINNTNNIINPADINIIINGKEHTYSYKSVDEINKCLFTPIGDTINECKSMCVNNTNENKCFVSDCVELCNNCKNEKCKWNISLINNNNRYKPNSSIIKLFPGNKSIKITWLKPDSLYLISKYYIIIFNKKSDFLQIHTYINSANNLEYIINNLENNIMYHLILVSKNKIGISDVSNIDATTPNKTSEFYDNKPKINRYDDSLLVDSYNKKNINYKEQISLYEKQLIYSELKDILLDKLTIRLDKNIYNIDIF